ncbi:MAG: PAS domain S-box protein [Erythrobacter sp.]|nr:PAS domain S-box protein [Erythrobacter sp.]
MAARIRDHDWGATSLGSADCWPQSLRTAVDLMLDLPAAAMILWGPEHVQIYNDAYIAIARDRHPGLLGCPVATGWADAYDPVIAPLLESALAGRATRLTDFVASLAGPDGPEDRVFDSDWSPLRDETGAVAGALEILVEVTSRHKAEAVQRDSQVRQAFLLKLSDAVRPLVAPVEIQAETTRLLREHLNAGWAYYVDWDLDGKHGLVLRDSVREGLPSFAGAHDVSDARGFLELLTGGATRTVSDFANYEQLPRRIRQRFGGLGLRSMMMAPLVKQGRLIATLFVGDTQIREWSESEASLLVEVAERTWAAIERGRAEAAVRQSEQQLRDVLDSMSEGFALFDPDFTIRDVNAETVRLDGRGREALIGRNHWEVFPGTEHSPLGELYKQVMRDRVPRDIEYAHEWPDGKTTWVEARVYPTTHGRIACQWQDITSRRQARTALHDSEERFRSLFASSPTSFLILDIDAPFFTIIDVNDAYLAATMRTRDDLIGRSLFEAFPDNPDESDPVGVRTLRGSLETVLATRRADTLPDLKYDVARPDGSFEQRWWSPINAPLLSATGEVTAIIHHVKNVTEQYRAQEALRQSEEQFRRSVLDAPIPVIMHAEDGEVLQISRSWTELTGYTIEDSEVIQGWLTRAYGYGGESVRDAMKEPFAPQEAERPIRGVVFPITTRQGEQRHWSFSASSPGTLGDGRRFVIGMAEDITERSQAEAALVESEALFRTLTEAIEDVFYVRDLDAERLDYLSPAYEAVWGRPVARLMDDLTRFIDAIHPDDRAAVRADLARQARGEAVHSEYRIIRPDGEVRWILDRCFPMPDGGRRLSAGVASDITERKMVESALRSSEERLRLVVEGARDYAIFTIDPEGRVVDWYSGAERVFGYSADEIRGYGAECLYTPEDRARGEDSKELAQACETGSAPNIRWHPRKDGGRVFIEGHIVALRASDGTLRGYLKIGQDVTEAKRVQRALTESEERLRTLTEGIPQLVWRSGKEGHWTWSSPQWQAFTGQNLKASLDLGWLDALHPDDRDAAMRAWRKAVPADGVDVEYRVRRNTDGAYIWHHTRAVPVRDRDGRIAEWLGTTTDVQELKEMQERQAVLVAELQHRTQNLMAVVRSISEKIARSSTDLADFRTRFRERLEALSRVQGLLSRLQEHDRVTFDKLVQTELAAMGSSDRITLEGPSGIRLRSSSVQTLALVLHELATNAVKYGALGQADARLAVTWWLVPSHESGRPWLHIDWRESGVVMPTAAEFSARGTGQGRELIENAPAYQLGGTTSFALGPDGVHCTMAVPVSFDTVKEKHD